MTVLIVDDEAISRALLKRIVEKAGFSDVTLAASGAEALDWLASRGGDSAPLPECILLDNLMPGMDGVEVLRTIKATPAWRDIPVLVVTADTGRDVIEEAFEAGAADFLEKPVSRQALRSRIRAASRLAREIAARRAREAELNAANQALADLNATLEERVRERTAALEAANKDLKALDRMKSAFMSNISHELRTPLTAVVGFAALLRGRLEHAVFPRLSAGDPAVDKAVDQVRRDLDVVAASADRLNGRIGDVLDLTMMESGRLAWRRETVDMAALLARVAGDYAGPASAKGLTLTCRVDDGLPAVTGDGDRLYQALAKLLDNALAFTKEGIIRLGARTVAEGIEAFVCDTGTGFRAGELSQVFETFRQLGDPLTGKPDGVGLGVPIAKRIVAHHGGWMWAESEPGRGSCFRFILPHSTNDAL